MDVSTYMFMPAVGVSVYMRPFTSKAICSAKLAALLESPNQLP